MKIAVIGCGNWGTTVAKLIAENTVRARGLDENVLLWVREEVYDGAKISEDINSRHINPKYLPGVQLPANVVARTEYDFSDTDILVFCLPHQFLDCLRKFKIKSGAIGVNLCKGLIVQGEELLVPSEYIGRMLGIECSCLMGANIACEVAQGVLSDSTLGVVNEERGALLESVFAGSYFKPEVVPYDRSIEISGAVKNVVSIAVGICDGMGWGKNTLAVIFRQGLVEMKRLCESMGAALDVCSSACVGDLLVSCICGRNYKCGAAMGSKGLCAAAYEKSMNGQKLQGPDTALAVARWLRAKGRGAEEFPVIFAVNEICQNNAQPGSLLAALKECL